MFLRQALLVLIGLSAGGVISAGIFAFLAIIGVIPRLIGATETASHVMLYETMLILGGISGNLMDLYQVGIQTESRAMLCIFGTACGIFVGCLVMSLAETLKAFPVLNRRVGLAVGIQYVIAAIAAGKLVGSALYFVNGFGGA